MSRTLDELEKKKPITADWELSRGSSGHNMGFIRFCLAMMVVYSHCFPLTGQSAINHITLAHLDGGQITSGGLAVNLFFVLSGFLITRAYLKRNSTPDFIKNRIIRIYPAHLFAWVVCIGAIVPLVMGLSALNFGFGGTLRYAFKAVVLAIPAIDGIFPNNPMPGVLNGSLWTLRYEFGFYVLTILLGGLTLLNKRVVPLMLFLTIWGVSVLQHFSIIPMPSDEVFQLASLPLERPSGWLHLSLYFLAGMAFYLYRESIPFSRHLAIIAGSIMVGALILPFRLFDVVAPVVAPYVLFCIMFSVWPKWGIKSAKGHEIGQKKPFDFTNLSYGIYLYAFPIQQLFVHFTHNGLSPYALFVAVMPCAIVMALLSWRIIDLPIAMRMRADMKNNAVVADPAVKGKVGLTFTFAAGDKAGNKPEIEKHSPKGQTTSEKVRAA